MAWSTTGGVEPGSAAADTDWRYGTTISVVGSWTHTATREAPTCRRSTSSSRSTAAWAS